MNKYFECARVTTPYGSNYVTLKHNGKRFTVTYGNTTDSSCYIDHHFFKDETSARDYFNKRKETVK